MKDKEMRRRKRSNHLISHMNVVPYIDVMLVLLIIFMVTAPMFVPAVINLPSVGTAATVTTPPIEISLTADGAYSIQQNSKIIPIKNLDNLIAETKNLAKGNTPVVISADKEVKYNNVITIIDRLYSANIKKVALVVKKRDN